MKRVHKTPTSIEKLVYSEYLQFLLSADGWLDEVCPKTLLLVKLVNVNIN
jgi:hypothetical protein